MKPLRKDVMSTTLLRNSLITIGGVAAAYVVGVAVESVLKRGLNKI
jgi:hypothetical protein